MDHDPLENEYPDPADLDDGDDPDDDQAKCPECGEWIYDDTDQCPYCGNWIVPSKALRGGRSGLLVVAVAIMLALMLFFSLRGCLF